jgi:thiamine-monophosphate kinase
LSVCVTVHGLVDERLVLRRDGARIDDDVWVSGTLGDAAGALAQWQAGQAVDPGLRARLDRPMPRMAAGLALAGIAHAAIDVSDGLLADLAHICVASGVGADIDIGALPSSPALRACFDASTRRTLQATGGDDYELCFAVPVARRAAIDQLARDCGVTMTRIGRVTAGDTVRALQAGGRTWHAPRTGYAHFAG